MISIESSVPPTSRGVFHNNVVNPHPYIVNNNKEYSQNYHNGGSAAQLELHHNRLNNSSPPPLIIGTELVQTKSQPSFPRNVLTHPIQSVSDLITSSFLGSRLLPKIGSIVKRFNLNYAGEGLVTDRENSRVVRVGIRFQVQVDSFKSVSSDRTRGLSRSASLPAVTENSSESNLAHKNSLVPLSDPLNSKSGGHNKNGRVFRSHSNVIREDEDLGESKGLSRFSNNSSVDNHQEPVEEETNSSFHSRINQALSHREYRRRSCIAGQFSYQQTLPSSRDHSNHSSRSSSAYSSLSSSRKTLNGMEDSTYQVLRHFPGKHFLLII